MRPVSSLLAPLARVLGVICLAVLALFAAGCGKDESELARIAMPARFALLRDTAQWVPEFDPVWWKEIDAAYAEYDGTVERIVRERWQPFAQELSLASQSDEPFAPDDARTRRARQRAIENELAAAERALVARIDSELPDTADRFIALLSARIECARATAVWAEPGRPLPGPLETLSRVGVHAGDDAILSVATESYRAIAREASQLTVDRAKSFLDWTGDFGPLDAALREATARAPDGKGRAVTRAQKALDARRDAMRAVRATTDETLRMKLLSEGDAFARAIADEAVRAEFTERLEADLHEGMSTTRTMEMYARVAERVIARANPDDPSVVDAFRADAARGLELQRTRRAQLRSSDAAERTDAYKALAKMPGEIIKSAGKKLDSRLSGRLFWQAVRVDLGQIDERDAVEAVFAQDPPEFKDTELPDSPQAIADEIGGASRTPIYGSALSPRVLRVLAAALRLEGERKAEFDAVVEEETRSLLATLRVENQRMEEASRRQDRSRESIVDGASLREAVQDTMSTVRSATAAILARNRAANARVLDAAVRIAGVDAGDYAIEEARIELELLAQIGSRGLGAGEGRGELEAISGATTECYSSPFAVARMMKASEGERAAALAVIAGHGAELVSAAEKARAGIYDCIEDFLKIVLARDRAKELGLPPWKPVLASAEPVELRFRIVEEIELVLGSEVAREYERCWRRLERPALETERAAAIARIESALARPDLDPVADAALRAALAASAGTREHAVHAAHRWRATTPIPQGMDSADQWRTAVFVHPLGAHLYSRIADADDRGVATCEAIAALAGASEQVRDALRIRERPIVKTLRPR